MPTSDHSLRSSSTRRDVLKLTGGLLAGLGAVGQASAASETIRVNVGYDSPSALEAVESVASEVLYDFEFDAATVLGPADVLTLLAERDDVRYAERDGEMEAIAQSTPWGVDRVDADVAHENGATGSGVDVAVIDTGIDGTHPDLRPALGDGRAFLSGLAHPLWQDDNGHGTHVAGTVNAVDDDSGVVGVSTEATLHAVKVLSGAGTGSTSDVAKGIEYTAQQAWDVANLSLGGSESELLREAVEYADREGVLLVAAAGNDGPCSDCVGYPAAYPECLAVSATTSDDELASFSSTGPEVDIAAPGEDVESTHLLGGYQTLSGTSMASPHVAGAAAQLVGQGHAADGARERLLATAEDIDLANEEQGSGLLDVAAALDFDSSDDFDGSEDDASGSLLDVV